MEIHWVLSPKSFVSSLAKVAIAGPQILCSHHTIYCCHNSSVAQSQVFTHCIHHVLILFPVPYMRPSCLLFRSTNPIQELCFEHIKHYILLRALKNIILCISYGALWITRYFWMEFFQQWSHVKK